MTDKLRHCLGISLPLLLLWALLAACSKPPAEAQIRQRLDEMQAAIVARKAGDFSRSVSEDFQGNESLDRAHLHQLLAGALLGEESVGVSFLGPAEIRLLKSDRAIVRLSVLATGGRWLPDHGQKFEIESGWRIENGTWVCYTASWK